MPSDTTQVDSEGSARSGEVAGLARRTVEPSTVHIERPHRSRDDATAV